MFTARVLIGYVNIGPVKMMPQYATWTDVYNNTTP